MRDHIAKLKEAVFYHKDSARLRVEDAEFALSQLAAKEQEVADLKRELEEAQISKLAVKQAYDAAVETSIRHHSRAEAAEARVKELEQQVTNLETVCRASAKMHGAVVSRLAALISAAEPLMNWPAQDFDGKSYRTIPADLFNGFATAVEKAKGVT